MTDDVIGRFRCRFPGCDGFRVLCSEYCRRCIAETSGRPPAPLPPLQRYAPEGDADA